MTDENHFLKRLKRHGQNTASLGGLAGRFLLGDRDSFPEALTQTLGNLKGPVMKVAQILSTVPDMLPSDYVEALSALQSQAPPMGWLFVKRRLRMELGEDWEKKFASFDKNAAAAASLGQVHRATHLDGQDLAIKIQYPDMAATVEADLQQVKLLLKLHEKSQGSLKVDGVLKEIGARLREELDYTQESRNINVFRAIFQEDTQIHVPTVYPDLSTNRLLTMDWLEGEKLTTFEGAPEDMRNHLARTLFRAWYKPFYQYGIIHGDPHLGNYTATPEGHLNLFDFGCVRVFDPSFIEGVLVLYEALKTKNIKQTFEAYEIWGFEHLTQEVVDVLNLWAQYLYAPLLDDSVRYIHPELNSQEGQKLARTITQKLKDLGGIAPPREFVFMDRAAVGLGSVFMRLKAKLNWHDLFHELVDGFERDAVLARQEGLLRKIRSNDTPE